MEVLLSCNSWDMRVRPQMSVVYATKVLAIYAAKSHRLGGEERESVASAAKERLETRLYILPIWLLLGRERA